PCFTLFPYTTLFRSHFNTWGFDKLYRFIADHSGRDGDTLVFDGLRIFPGMETDIAEGGHILSVGPMEAILELNHRLEPHKGKGKDRKSTRLNSSHVS